MINRVFIHHSFYWKLYKACIVAPKDQSLWLYLLAVHPKHKNSFWDLFVDIGLLGSLTFFILSGPWTKLRRHLVPSRTPRTVFFYENFREAFVWPTTEKKSRWADLSPLRNFPSRKSFFFFFWVKKFNQDLESKFLQTGVFLNWEINLVRAINNAYFETVQVNFWFQGRHMRWLELVGARIKSDQKMRVHQTQTYPRPKLIFAFYYCFASQSGTGFIRD